MTAERSYRGGVYFLNAIIVFLTFLLILWGGFVKSFEAGLAFPDWPTSDGYFMWFYPFDDMVGKKFWEHSHRLIASFVGVLMIGLTVLSWKYETRKKVRMLTNVAMLTVIVQGCLGGLTVLYALEEKILSIAHAGLAQVFLLMVFSLCIFNSHRWLSGEPKEGVESLAFRFLPPAILIQTLLGACYRHWGEGSWLVLHILGAIVVALFSIWSAVAILTDEKKVKHLVRAASLLLSLLVLQIILGGMSFFMKAQNEGLEVIPVPHATTFSFHVLVGALMISVAMYLYLYSKPRVRV